jgi:hypothetical protein
MPVFTSTPVKYYFHFAVMIADNQHEMQFRKKKTSNAVMNKINV